MSFLFEVIVHTMCSVLVDVLCIYSITVIGSLPNLSAFVSPGVAIESVQCITWFLKSTTYSMYMYV